MTKSSDPDRRTIDELLTLLTVEPTLRDIIVEGRSDAAVIRWYLRHHGLNAKVYAVDDRVSVPSDVVRELGLDVNNRGEVIALAITVDQQLPYGRLTCIADSDFRILLESEKNTDGCTSLLFTDFAAMECYTLEPAVIDKLLRLVLGKSDEIDAGELLDEMMGVLVDLFLVRAAIRLISPEDGLVGRFERSIKEDQGHFALDIDDLVRRSLPSNAAARKEVVDVYSDLKARIPTDKRCAVRGHDIGKVLIRVARINGKFADHGALESSLMGCLEASSLDTFPMFKKLRLRVAS